MVPQSEGADLAAKNVFGATPLHLAVGRNLSNIMLKMLITPETIAAVDEDGQTSLHWAALFAEKRSIAAGINPDWVADEGLQRTSVEMLLDNGADIEARDQRGRTPLRIAVEFNKVGNVESLLERGADSRALANDGQTPYQMAEERGTSEEILRLLRKRLH